MASTNGTSFGASIVPVEQRTSNSKDNGSLPTITLDSPAITPTASREDLTTTVSQQHDTSPFYNLPAQPQPTHTRQSSKPTAAATENEKDLEAGGMATRNDSLPLEGHDEEENPFTSKVSVDYNKECAMWPSKATLLSARQAAKKQRRGEKRCAGCIVPVQDFWARFTARQKLMLKILLALLLIGIVTGVGVGISIAVNGTVYVNPNSSQTIPQPGRRVR